MAGWALTRKQARTSKDHCYRREGGVRDVAYFREPYTPRTLGQRKGHHFMTIYQEKIAPPLAPLNGEGEVALLVESLAVEDR